MATGFRLCFAGTVGCSPQVDLDAKMTHKQVLEYATKQVPPPPGQSWLLVRPSEKKSDPYMLWKPGMSLGDAAGARRTIYVWPDKSIAIRVYTEDTDDLVLVLFWTGTVYDDFKSTWDDLSSQILAQVPTGFKPLVDAQSDSLFAKASSFVMGGVEKLMITLVADRVLIDDYNRSEIMKFLGGKSTPDVYPRADVRIAKNLRLLGITLSSDQLTRWLQLVGIVTVAGATPFAIESVTGINVLGAL